MRSHLAAIALAAAALLAVPAHALNVVTCEPEWAALVKELGGDKVNVSSATTALQDPHHIEARPSLIARMRGADHSNPALTDRQLFLQYIMSLGAHGAHTF